VSDDDDTEWSGKGSVYSNVFWFMSDNNNQLFDNYAKEYDTSKISDLSGKSGT